MKVTRPPANAQPEPDASMLMTAGRPDEAVAAGAYVVPTVGDVGAVLVKETVWAVDCTAPASQEPPASLVIPLWSVTGHSSEVPLGIIPMAGLVASRATVSVRPPLLASGASREERSSNAWLSPVPSLRHVLSLPTL